MDLSKSIGFLLENAGDIIRYRLRKEILNDLSETEEENFLEKIYQLPFFKLLASYVKPNGYIGVGMHTWSNWRGVCYHETPLQDGEAAARLLSYYAVPKNHPFVKGFAAAMRDEEVLRREFSYVPPAARVFENRFDGLNNGNCLMAMIYVMRAILGYGDDCDDVREFQQTALKGFKRVLEINSLSEITKLKPGAKNKYNYPYMEADEYFPDYYTLSMLAYTQSWRNAESTGIVARSINRVNEIMEPGANIHVRIKSRYMAPCFSFVRPFEPFDGGAGNRAAFRRTLDEMAMALGAESKNVEVLRRSVEKVEEALSSDGVLRLNFNSSVDKRAYINNAKYPRAYSEITLEPDYGKKYAFECDLTFWAIQFLCHYKECLPLNKEGNTYGY